MERQLVLLDPHADHWRLDDHTRQVGRQGIAQARAALGRARRRAEREPEAHDRRQPAA